MVLPELKWLLQDYIQNLLINSTDTPAILTYVNLSKNLKLTLSLRTLFFQLFYSTQ